MQNAPALPSWYAGACAVFGLVLLVFGYRLMRILVRVYTAVLFSAIGLLIGMHLKEPAAGVAITAGLGFLGYVLGDALYYINMVLNGATAGALLGGVAGRLAGRGNDDITIIAAVVGMTACGLLALKYEQGIGIFATSMIGSGLFTLAVWLAAPAFHHLPWAFGVMGVGLLVGGCYIQTVSSRHRSDPALERTNP